MTIDTVHIQEKIFNKDDYSNTFYIECNFKKDDNYDKISVDYNIYKDKFVSYVINHPMNKLL